MSGARASLLVELTEGLARAVKRISGLESRHELARGEQGLEGPPGARGPQGEPGPVGPIGKTGPRGLRGERGFAGETGAPGLRGEQGPRGELGPAGAQGPRGPTGEKGIRGANGKTPAIRLQQRAGRIVMEIHDWIDAEENAPETGYVGERGLVDDPRKAVDLRGAPGVALGGGNGLSRAEVLELIEDLPNINVRIVGTDTAWEETDDILIVTTAATIMLPDATTTFKFLRIKRSGAGAIRVQGINGQTVEGKAYRIINVNRRSLTLHSDGTNWVEL